MKFRVVILLLILGVYFYLDRGKPPKIYLKINAQSQVSMHGAIIPVDSLDIVINQIKQTYRQRDLKKYIVHITADKKASMGIISDVKQELRQSESLKLQFTTE